MYQEQLIDNLGANGLCVLAAGCSDHEPERKVPVYLSKPHTTQRLLDCAGQTQMKYLGSSIRLQQDVCLVARWSGGHCDDLFLWNQRPLVSFRIAVMVRAKLGESCIGFRP